jgi:DNA excision repair protein ERCC-2
VDPPYTVSVRNLCEFAAKSGDLDLRFTPSPTAQQGREGHVLVASRRGPEHESEVSLSGEYQGLRVRGRADGFDAARNTLEEVKTFRGSLAAMAANHQALHWAQLRVYGWLMCQSRGLDNITLCLVYLDVATQVEHPHSEEATAEELEAFFQALCQRFLGWSHSEARHRAQRDAALGGLEFPQKPFRPGQRELAGGVYRACMQSRPLLVQAPTGIGKTIGTVYPALRAMPQRGTDKLFFLTAKTPGRAVALDALSAVRRSPSAGPVFPLRVVELVARDKACEHKDKACHGQSCPLASGFYDRLAAARQAAAQAAWLDAATLRSVALAHGVCPYYLGQEMVRWSDVVVGDYNYYFDRSAMLHALVVDNSWRVTVLVDEAHNLYSRACSMYSADLTHAETAAVRPHVPARVRARLDDLLDQWQQLAGTDPPGPADAAWRLLERCPRPGCGRSRNSTARSASTCRSTRPRHRQPGCRSTFAPWVSRSWPMLLATIPCANGTRRTPCPGGWCCATSNRARSSRRASAGPTRSCCFPPRCIRRLITPICSACPRTPGR